MVPIIKPGIAKAGTFQPAKAPAKHNASKIAVLFTAPSRVIFSPIDTSYVVVKAGFPDLPKVFNAECLDM